MKSSVAKLTLVALIAAPLVAQAENVIAPAGRMENLSLLPGPTLLSPANATGEVVPGQTWKPKSAGVLSLRPATPARMPVVTFTSSSNLTLSAPKLVISSGDFYFRPATNPPARKEDSTRRLKLPEKPVNPESLHFDATLPRTEIRPLQKKPVPAPQMF